MKYGTVIKKKKIKLALYAKRLATPGLEPTQSIKEHVLLHCAEMII